MLLIDKYIIYYHGGTFLIFSFQTLKINYRDFFGLIAYKPSAQTWNVCSRNKQTNKQQKITFFIAGFKYLCTKAKRLQAIITIILLCGFDEHILHHVCLTIASFERS